MKVVGIDMGAKTIKIVVLEDNKILAKTLVLSGFDQRATVEQTFIDVLESAELSREAIGHITVTGAGRKDVPFANSEITEVSADARGATFLFTTARTTIDVGAEEGRGIKCSAEGKVIDFAINEKCAAGSGAFTEAMARALEVKLEDFGPLSLRSQNAIPMNAQCAIFAESEVVSLIHAKTPKEDIARAVHDAIASRITSMVRRVGIAKDVALIGGLARNPGFVASLKRELDVDFLIPDEPEYVGALGAALIAMDRAGGE